MAAIFGGVATDDIALHPRHAEIMHPLDLGHDPPLEPLLQPPDQGAILNRPVAAFLVAGVGTQHRFATLLAHEAGRLAAIALVSGDQLGAQIRLDDIGQHQHRGLHEGQVIGARHRHRLHCRNRPRDVRAVLGERNHLQHAQLPVDHHPHRAERCARHRHRIGRQHPEQSADRALEIPEGTIAGVAIPHPPLRLVRPIVRHEEKAGACIVEQVGPVSNRLQRGTRHRAARRPAEA